MCGYWKYFGFDLERMVNKMWHIDDDDFWGGFWKGAYYGTCTFLVAIIITVGIAVLMECVK